MLAVIVRPSAGGFASLARPGSFEILGFLLTAFIPIEHF
jgi:hypothetical protein